MRLFILFCSNSAPEVDNLFIFLHYDLLSIEFFTEQAQKITIFFSHNYLLESHFEAERGRISQTCVLYQRGGRRNLERAGAHGVAAKLITTGSPNF